MNRYARSLVIGLIVGIIGTGAAAAGSLLSPVDRGVGSKVPAMSGDEVMASVETGDAPIARDEELDPAEVPAIVTADVKAPTGGSTPVVDGVATFLVGASRVSLAPSPTHFGGQTWMTSGCTTYGTEGAEPPNSDHVLPPVDPADPIGTTDEIRSWPASSPDCVYLGGFGIGPVRPAQRVGHGGVWIRSIAISNGSKTFVYQIADLVGWFAKYDSSICVDCGILDVRKELAAGLGVPIGDIVTGSTHSHATADTYGGWGGIPKWYREQIRDSAVAGAKQAVANLAPATIQVGDTHLRDRNNERRDTYYSNADTAASWLQATGLPTETCTTPAAAQPSAGTSDAGAADAPSGKGKKKPKPTATPTATPTPTVTPEPTPVCTTTPGDVVATLGTYAAHPTIVGDPILHADWPGASARRFETRFGGVGLMFEGGLGNVSVSGVAGANEEEEAENTGRAIADDIATDIAEDPTQLQSSELESSAQVINHPAATNPGLTTLATVGLFDREFTPGTEGAGPPSVYHWSRGGEASTAGEDNDIGPNGAVASGCSSAGPTVITSAGAHQIGELLIAFTPGEIFSNVSEVIRERTSGNAVAMTFGQSNDALGYIIQSFEFDNEGNAVTEYGSQTGEYEEVFAIDRCFGDHVLETVLESTKAIGFGG